MKKNVFLIAINCILSFFLFTACSSETNEAEKRVEAAKVVELRNSQDLLNDLYLACDGDKESLARILQITPSSIERLRSGKTVPTLKFEEKIKTVAIYYYHTGRKFSKLQSALDSEYGWYDSVLNFPSHHPWIFWICNIIILLILAFAAIIAIWPILIEMVIFLLAWLASLIFSPDVMVDNYTTTINNIIEQII